MSTHPDLNESVARALVADGERMTWEQLSEDTRNDYRREAEIAIAVVRSDTWPDAPYTVNPKLVRDILAAVAFLYADAIPEDVYERLNAPSDRMLGSLNKLVGIRQEEARAA